MVLEGRSHLLRSADGRNVSVTGLPPHDIAAEEAVIAALLLSSDAMSACQLARLEPLDFFREQNAWVYEACAALHERGDAVTIPTVAHELERAGRLDAAGGEPYLAEIAGKYFTAVGIEAHIRIVRRDSLYRRLIGATSQIAQLAYEGGPDPKRVIEHGLGLLTGLVTDGDTGLERLGLGGIDDEPGRSWGIPILDHRTMGVRPRELVIIAGGVGEGKSMLAAQIARTVALDGGRVAMWTTEMTNHRYELRMAHAMSGVRSIDNLYDPPHTPDERARLMAGMEAVSKLDISSSAAPGMTADMIAAAVRLHGADLVVVDYLQMLSMPKSDSESSALKQTTKTLKQLAAETNCAVLLASQMNRAAQTEMRGKDSGKLTCVLTGEKYPRPFMQALMGGAVEGDADLVVMLQRHINCTDQHMQVVIAKNRNGRTGDGMLFPNFSFCRYEALSEAECYAMAGSSMAMSEALLKDQGWWTVGRKAQP